jgi:hypothetical protein
VNEICGIADFTSWSIDRKLFKLITLLSKLQGPDGMGTIVRTLAVSGTPAEASLMGKCCKRTWPLIGCVLRLGCNVI